jgi:hypothetical protein
MLMQVDHFDQVKSWRFAKVSQCGYRNFNSYSAQEGYAVARSLINGQSGYSDTVGRLYIPDVRFMRCKLQGLLNLEPLEMVRASSNWCRWRCLVSTEIINNLKRRQFLGRPRSGEQWADGLDISPVCTEG